MEVELTDYNLMSNPILNKGMAFTEEERDAFYLHGLLPPQVATLSEQRLRSYNAFKSKPSDLEKYIYLRDLQDSNETLFYNLITHHIEEMIPIIYTPTVGLGCQKFSHIYRRPRGLFVSYPNKHRIDKILENHRFDTTEVIVVSDGERVLGLGDQGAGGMGIPIGKLSLYTACAGIHPASTLPIFLDTGTDNKTLLDDPLYIGWKHARIRGQEYDDFIDAFVASVKKRFPHVLLQWEDFAQQNASCLLDRYRDKLCTFNDDIQGTAAVATATLLAACHKTEIPITEQKIVVVGAGSAGCGISDLMMQMMVKMGLSEKRALASFFLIDRNGLLMEGQELLPFQQKFAQRWEGKTASLKEVIEKIHPTALIGVSGQPGIFSEEIVRLMAKHVKNPIIFPLSNPTSRSEATPTDLMHWSEGRAIISTGSPFDSIIKNGKPFRVDQTNNCYIFPGVGLGVIAVKARRISNEMFLAAAVTLAELSPAKNDPEANLLPPLEQIREVSFKIAVAVAIAASSEKDVQSAVKSKVWEPVYVPYTNALR